MSTHTNTTTDSIRIAPAGEYLRYSGIDEARKALREGEELLIGGFPKHIVTVWVNPNATDSTPSELLNFGLAEDEVQAQVVKTDMSLAQLVEQFGTLEAKAKLAEIDRDLNRVCFNLHLIGKLGFNL
jgi:hypothetical protein